MRRCPTSTTSSVHGTRHGDAVRTALERGSGSLTSLALLGSVVVLALGGLGGATVILRVTAALREAELAATSVASRALAGDPTPCEPAINRIESCLIAHGVATVRLSKDGVVATAVAGPDG